jgi:butyryl-CoA dehydrogenase
MTQLSEHAMSWIDDSNIFITEDERLIQQSARKIAEISVAPRAKQIDADHHFPRDLIPELANLGFFGACGPEEYGGSALSHVAYALIIEELAAACASTAIIVSAHNSLCVAPIVSRGTSSQKKRLLPNLLSGREIGCFALSEPGMGSDAASLTCTAKSEGSTYIISGTKNWITNGPESTICILFASVDTTLRHKGIACFAHRLDLPGISFGKTEEKLGIRGSPTCSITYDNVILTEDDLLANPGEGFRIAMETLDGGRIGVAAQAIGIARSALHDALLYSTQRKTFDKFIAHHQSVQNYMADMVTSITAARLLTVQAARLQDEGRPFARHAAMAKLAASRSAVDCANKGLQIHGGYGFVSDFPAERHYRDAKITEIYEGTSEIQQLVIASQLVKEYFDTSHR